MKQLADDPTVPLFFGRRRHDARRLDRRRRSTSGGGTSPTPTGEPMVIDWRAPVSLPFYRASPAEPMGVGRAPPLRLPAGPAHRLRGRGPRARPAGAEEHSAILEAEIERPRVGPMRDIVATIQPEQDVIVRSELSRSVCVQGAPGHRQDGRRPAPRGVPPLCAPRAADPAGRAGGRAERQLPALHPRRAAGARRDRREADHDRGARRDHAAAAPAAQRDPRRGPGRRGDAEGRRPDGGRAGAGALVAGRAARPRALVVPRGARRWRVAGVRGRGAGGVAARARGAVRRRRGRWCRSRSRTGSW